MRQYRLAFLMLAAIHYVLLGQQVQVSAQSIEPSLCVVTNNQCHVANGTVQVAVELGSSTTLVKGAQLALSYDPASLMLVDVAPGSACDSMSPFVQQLSKIVDEINGDIFFAVFGDFGTPGTTGPAAVACLTFVVLSESDTDICLVDGLNPTVTKLIGNFGSNVPIDNTTECSLEGGQQGLSCMAISISPTCHCPVGLADCSNLDSSCTTGICDDASGQCEAIADNEGQPCDDGDSCSIVDNCSNGYCVGTGCDLPSLCITTNQPTCETSAPEMLVSVELGEGLPLIAGAQLNIQYDPGMLEIVSVSPGTACSPISPFDFPLFQYIDEINGMIEYAVSVSPGALDQSTSNAATIACIVFRVLEPMPGNICLVEGSNPFETFLSGQQGQRVRFFNGENCPSNALAPLVSCVQSCRLVPPVSGGGTSIFDVHSLAEPFIENGR